MDFFVPVSVLQPEMTEVQKMRRTIRIITRARNEDASVEQLDISGSLLLLCSILE
jgi:hypothetical protein